MGNMPKCKVFEELKLALEDALSHEQGEKINLRLTKALKSPKGTFDSSPNTVHLRKCSMFGVEVISPGRGGEKLAQRVSAGKDYR
jgi:hypothetical protein